ncbi:PHA/PHB synthase family protein [Aromatoleum anaerobium]|uniref:Class I poly(R)-hydroxyalkanoic acid synthase n=1 Tax=Aromatoleum anaerobium TaxID=182180 RepID=A0ABX1PG62_9RHOO|nr:class I poly(R)-hydroxyalkanoic acid synthase [Aromatoleum anaerobium]MCK0507546.1 class I poly(R)-hydroxyalkanoic acid synthase [Aromatoleum anaerobium]
MSSQTQYAQTPTLQEPGEITKTFAEVAERSAKLICEHFRRRIEKGITPPGDELGIAAAFMEMMAKLLSNPYVLAPTQMNLLRDHFSLWQRSVLRCMGVQASPMAIPAKGDNRFRDEQWEEHFLFDFIKQSYLIVAHHVHGGVSKVEGLESGTQRKVDFFTRQCIDALSPSNFALTNPEVVRETVKSHGQNLIKGFKNLLRDIEEGDGSLRIRMTDAAAFKLGSNVATTPGKVVFENELMQLLQFAPTTREVFKRPLLIIPPWINKYYILDLREKNSFIKWATDQGHTVFVISWVNPDETLAHTGFGDYMTQGALTAVNAVCRQTGEDKVNAVGYCLGGTLLATTLAWMAAKKDERIASATFFTTMLDFSEPGELGVFIDDQAIASLEKKMAARGFLDGSEMAGVFNMLRANDLIWSFVVNNYLMGKDPFPFDLLYWNSDSTRMPARMHSFYLRELYMKNRLKEPGGVTLDGVPIDLGKIRVPAYFVSAIEDHIAPWTSTYVGARLFNGPVRFVLGGSGHIAGIINPPAANKYGYWVNPAAKPPASANQWFAGATQHAGSWWNDWSDWAAAQDGGEKVVARDPAAGRLKVLEDAPGTYVRFRLDAKRS